MIQRAPMMYKDKKMERLLPALWMLPSNLQVTTDTLCFALRFGVFPFHLELQGNFE